MSWWEAVSLFVAGAITGYCIASAVRNWRRAWGRAKVSAEAFEAETKR